MEMSHLRNVVMRAIPGCGSGVSQRRVRHRFRFVLQRYACAVLTLQGPNYMRLDTQRDGLHAFPITRSWKELTNGVDAVFSYKDRIYFIQGDQVYIYKAGAHFTLIEGYPKTLKEELNIEGQVDAAFVCPQQDTAHIIQGRKMLYIDLTATPRVVTLNVPLPFADVDAGFCSSDGIKLFKGSDYYHYDSPMLLAMSRIAPIPQKVTSAMVGCED